MKFCEKCGNLLFIEKKGKSIKLVCRKCKRKYKTKHKDRRMSVGEKFKNQKKDIVVIEKKEAEFELPVIDILCPECGNKKAYWQSQEIGGLSEESSTFTIFYTCTKCNHKWRSTG